MKRIGGLIIIVVLLVGIYVVLQHNVEEVKVAPVKLMTADDSLNYQVDSLLKNAIPVLGYRFVVTGDFNGDHVIDTLFERYTDSNFQKEVPKYYSYPDAEFDYGDLVFLSGYLGWESFLEWKDVDLKLKGGQLGFHYIENCGDLNVDGKDEILVLKQIADWSNLNTAHIYTIENNQWKEIAAISVWEWQFPPTPAVSMIPGMFGNYDFGTSQNDSMDVELEKQLLAYEFIHYYSDKSVEFSGNNLLTDFGDEIDSEELDEIGQQGYIKKHFKKVYLNDSLYLKDINHPAVYYKASETTTKEYGNIIMFNIDDLADMTTVRIFINHPKSPFRK